ncbi:hypothetical protein AALB39_19645 [Lachnospiraceae bacterium 54-53]
MKKSSFIAMILGTISCIFFALGMCMTMLPEWNAFQPGVIIGCVGLVFALITVFVWRRMEHKDPISITPKAVGMPCDVMGEPCAGYCCRLGWYSFAVVSDPDLHRLKISIGNGYNCKKTSRFHNCYLITRLY